MAHDKKKTTYDWQPVEFNGKLTGLSLRKEERFMRVSDDGKILDRGWGSALIEEIAEIPIDKVADLVRGAVDWLAWFAQDKDEEVK